MRELTQLERLTTGLMTLRNYNKDAEIDIFDGWIGVRVEFIRINDADRRLLGECQWVYSIVRECWMIEINNSERNER
jgi:hypothetical protein